MRKLLKEKRLSKKTGNHTWLDIPIDGTRKGPAGGLEIEELDPRQVSELERWAELQDEEAAPPPDLAQPVELSSTMKESLWLPYNAPAPQETSPRYTVIQIVDSASTSSNWGYVLNCPTLSWNSSFVTNEEKKEEKVIEGEEIEQKDW